MKKLLFLIILVCAPLLFAQSTPIPNKPPLKPGKIAVELVSATISGLGLTLGSVYVYSALNSNSNGWDELGAVLLIIGTAYPVGSAAGAYLVGNSRNKNGSFWAALGGSAAGAAAAISLFAVTNNSSLGYLFYILPPVGAVIGHNLSRSWALPPGNALLNFREGLVNAGIPSLQLRPSYRKGSFNKQFRILSIQF